MKNVKPTVSANWLSSGADKLESDAEANFTAWIACGQSAKYGEAKDKARTMREAMRIRNIGERRAFLLSRGIDA